MSDTHSGPRSSAWMTGISAKSQSQPSNSRLQWLVHSGKRRVHSRVHKTIQTRNPGWTPAATDKAGPVNSMPQALKRASTMSRNLVLFMSSRVRRESSFPDLSKTKYLDSEFRDSFAMKYGT